MYSLYEQSIKKTINSNAKIQFLYNVNLTEFSTKTTTSRSLIAIIDDYNKAIEILTNDGIACKNEFNRKAFAELLGKIKTLGIRNWSNLVTDFTLFRTYLIAEVYKRDVKSAESFQQVFSNFFVVNKHKDVLNLLYIAISHYVELLVNTHQDTKTTINTKRRLGNTFFTDLEKEINNKELKLSIKAIQSFLETITDEIIKSGDFKKDSLTLAST